MPITYKSYLNLKGICLLLAASFGLTACGQGYAVRNGKAYFFGWNEGFGSFEHVVAGADASSFVAISDFFAIDDRQAYAYGIPLVGSDPKTFHIVGGWRAYDKDNCYIGTPNALDPSKKKPAGFRPAYVITDKEVKYRYWETTGKPRPTERVVPGADASSFKDMSFGFAKDATRVYRYGVVIIGDKEPIDVATVTAVNPCELRDKNGNVRWNIDYQQFKR